MRRIEITTAQKVTIQYELAALKDRILAYAVDMVVLFSVIFVLFFIISAAAFTNDELYTILLLLILAPIFIFYTLVSELLMKGQTLGKRAMGLKVVKLNGSIPSLDDFLVRWVFRWIDIYTSFGAIAALLISAGDKSQRVGGLLSNTAVVKLKGGYNIKLADLESMFKGEDYEAQYPNVTLFNDEDMLALKDLIKRYNQFPNTAHRQLVVDTAETLRQRLDLKKEPRNRLEFLRAVLKDYVMLTR